MGMDAPSALQEDLFEVPQAGPEGFVYFPRFIDSAEERDLLGRLAELPVKETPYKEYTARRRTVSYGVDYDPGHEEGRTSGPIPEFLLPLRKRLAVWAHLPEEAFVQGLVSEYRPGTPLGWHRDQPAYEAIVGLSLGAPCRMRFRPYRPDGRNRSVDVLFLDLMPRSAYRMCGPARRDWQHSVSPTPGLRYSITFRTLRAKS